MYVLRYLYQHSGSFYMNIVKNFFFVTFCLCIAYTGLYSAERMTPEQMTLTIQTMLVDQYEVCPSSDAISTALERAQELISTNNPLTTEEQAQAETNMRADLSRAFPEKTFTEKDVKNTVTDMSVVWTAVGLLANGDQQ